MTNWYVGQEIECIDDADHGLFYVSGHKYIGTLDGLKKGRKYTIRGIIYDPTPAWRGTNLYLNEIVRPIVSRHNIEPPYYSARFRPLVKTDISIFEAMLHPIPTKQQEPVKI